MAARYSDPVPQYSDANNNVFASGKLQFFENGTTTPKNVFSDVAGTISLGNELTLDARGAVPDFFGVGTYRVRLLDVNSVQIFERDDVVITSPQADQFSAWDAGTTYIINDTVQGTDALYYISLTNGNLNNNPVTDLVNWAEIVFLEKYNANKTYAVQDLAIGSDGFIYRSLANGNINNDPTVSPVEWGSATKVDTTALNILPRGYQFGFDQMAADVGDLLHDINIPAGVARDSTDSFDLKTNAALIKRIDANWAPGTNLGGFPSALTLTADTRYWVFVILKNDEVTVDAGFDSDINATNLLADATDYVQFRRFGYFYTDGSANLQNVEPLAIDHPGSIKAFVNFDGTGTVAIRDSYNVKSITDNGAGDYTVNFINDFDSSNYSFFGSAGPSTSGITRGGVVYSKSGTISTSSITLFTARNADNAAGPTLQDYSVISVSFLGG